MPISPSAALYLAADAVAPRDKKLSMGIAVPGRDVSVDLKSLSAILTAAALWSLRESGAAAVQFEQKKGLFGTKDRVAVRPGPGGQPRSQAEHDLWQGMTPKHPYARDLVARWIGRESVSPWGMVVTTFENELVQAGILTPAEPQNLMGKVGVLAGKRVQMIPNPQAIQATRPEVEAILQRWHAFNQHEAPLAQALVKECRDGIDSQLDTD